MKMTKNNLIKKMKREREKRDVAMAKASLSKKLAPVPRASWPHHADPFRVEVWLSSGFLAQVFTEGSGVLRVSVNRLATAKGAWVDGISWDELMEVKRQIGRGQEYAVEVLPRDDDIVNVAQMRHFWILPEHIVGWRRDGATLSYNKSC